MAVSGKGRTPLISAWFQVRRLRGRAVASPSKPVITNSAGSAQEAVIDDWIFYPVTGGTLSLSLDDATLSAAGASGTASITGTLSATLADAGVAASGNLPIAGTLSATLGAATFSASGALPIAGSLSTTLASTTLAASGNLPITGTLSGTLDALTLAGSGSQLSDNNGAVTATLDDLTAIATATLSNALSYDRGDVGGGKEWRNAPRQKRYQFDGRKFNEVLASVPDTPPTSRKAKKKLAKQIIVAAGDSDLLPLLSGFGDELQQIGTAAIEAAQTHSITQAQAHYSRILAIIDQIEAQIAEDEADEDDVIEQFLLAA